MRFILLFILFKSSLTIDQQCLSCLLFATFILIYCTHKIKTIAVHGPRLHNAAVHETELSAWGLFRFLHKYEIVFIFCRQNKYGCIVLYISLHFRFILCKPKTHAEWVRECLLVVWKFICLFFVTSWFMIAKMTSLIYVIITDNNETAWIGCFETKFSLKNVTIEIGPKASSSDLNSNWTIKFFLKTISPANRSISDCWAHQQSNKQNNINLLNEPERNRKNSAPTNRRRNSKKMNHIDFFVDHFINRIKRCAYFNLN